ncbi:hypothetical protein ACFOWE_29500 [Planomonospora corallina]|uniref:Uncharacterized protein n=1 Tax=Planomonospora corallina TaxID=1806052 RepID=A0ABV8IGZ4_9ACTN
MTGNARIEDLAWVNSGATVGGDAVVKGNALVQSGARLSGGVVVGGDAEPAQACASGTYLMFDPGRGCDGRAGEADVNPPHPVFGDDDLAFSGGSTSKPTPTPTSGGGSTPVNLATAAKASASYTSPWESVAAINDGHDSDPRWGTWPRTGTQWAEPAWPSTQTVKSAQVRFFDDGGGVRVPASWKLQYWNGRKYTGVSGASGYGIRAGAYNTVAFEAVRTTRLRVVLRSGQASVGLTEVRAFG